MRVFLDDEREAPEGWKPVYTAPQCIELLKTGKVDELSLDHDLGGDDDPSIGTGYQVVCWVEEQVFMHDFSPPAMYIHSANAPGRQKMKQVIRKIEEYIRNKK